MEAWWFDIWQAAAVQRGEKSAMASNAVAAAYPPLAATGPARAALPRILAVRPRDLCRRCGRWGGDVNLGLPLRFWLSGWARQAPCVRPPLAVDPARVAALRRLRGAPPTVGPPPPPLRRGPRGPGGCVFSSQPLLPCALVGAAAAACTLAAALTRRPARFCPPARLPPRRELNNNQLSSLAAGVFDKLTALTGL